MLDHALGMAAVVAHQPTVCGMIGQRNAASGTFRNIAALPAQKHTAAAAAIEKQNALLPFGNVQFQFPAKRFTDTAGIAVADLLPKVCNGYLRQRLLIVSPSQKQGLIGSFSGSPGTLDVRRC